MKIKGNKISLRKLKKSDALSIYRNMNNEDVLRYITTSYPYQIENAYDFIRKSHAKIRAKTGYDLGIFMCDTGELVGMVSLMNINIEYKNAELGCWLGQKYWRHGIMSEAINLILDYGFKELGLVRIYAKVMHPNKASYTGLKKSGFKYEGRMRKSCLKDGIWYDHLLYSMLSEEYLTLNNARNG